MPCTTILEVAPVSRENLSRQQRTSSGIMGFSIRDGCQSWIPPSRCSGYFLNPETQEVRHKFKQVVTNSDCARYEIDCTEEPDQALLQLYQASREITVSSEHLILLE